MCSSHSIENLKKSQEKMITHINIIDKLLTKNPWKILMKTLPTKEKNQILEPAQKKLQKYNK